MEDITHLRAEGAETGSQNRYPILIGLLMVVVGGLAVLLPNLMGIGFNAYVAVVFALAAAVDSLYGKNDKMSLNMIRSTHSVLLIMAATIWLHPAVNVSVLGLLIALTFLLTGVLALMSAREASGRDRLLIVSGGVYRLAVSVWVFVNWPPKSALAFSLIVGGTFLVEGIVLCLRASLKR